MTKGEKVRLQGKTILKAETSLGLAQESIAEAAQMHHPQDQDIHSSPRSLRTKTNGRVLLHQ
jgi:hypothetical protein